MSDSNDFQDLKRLLKLKQHEVPPPGYFNHLSGDVIARIRAGDAERSAGLLERFEGTWVMGLLQIFQAKPGIIGGFATSLCLLLLIGVVMVDHQEGASTMSDIVSSQPNSGDLSSTAPLLAPDGSSGITVNTNSLHGLQASVAPFGSQQQNPLFLPASFQTSGQ
jgi:hypothetical protein